MGEEELSSLMERLRLKSREQRSWGDTIKALRSTTSQEKRHMLETFERIQLQRCLDTLQSAITVLGQQSLLARLRCIARQASLTFTEKSPQIVVISSEVFSVEVSLDAEKALREVRIAHQGEATKCPELLKLLSCGNFTAFTKHLEGLSSSYSITGDKKQKTKAFHALQSLETDLNLLAQLQSSINGVGNYIHKSPLGILIARTGGMPMKLIYFVSPYDLLDKKTKAAHPMTVEAIMDNELGQSVTVCLESHSSTKLQTMPLMTVNTMQDGKSLPSFSALSAMNSCALPTCFVLRLPKPIPIALSVVKKIYSLTNIDVSQGLESRPLLSLIVEDQSGGKMSAEDTIFVTLPEQQHEYFLQEGIGLGNQGAVLVSKVAFTHPTHVPQILQQLRQQLLFNSVIGSCVRPCANQGTSDSIVFEVASLSLQHVSVTFEHPLQQSMATVDLDLSDITNVKCKVLSFSEREPFVSDDQATKVFQRCLSIPVTMRAILLKVTAQLKKLMAEERQKSIQRQKAMRTVPPLMIPRPLPILKQQFSAPLPHSHQTHPQNDYELPALLDPTSASPELLDSLKAEKVAKNPMLASLLDQEPGVKESDNPMLSKLLDDQIPSMSAAPSANQAKQKKYRKRKPDALPTRSPKHRPSEDGQSDRSELETPSPLDVRMTQSVSSGGSGLTTPVIDLTDNESPFTGESHVSKLAHTVDKIIISSTSSDSQQLTDLPLTPDLLTSVNNVDPLTDANAMKWDGKDHMTRRLSVSNLWPDSLDSSGPIDPDVFTNKNVGVVGNVNIQRSLSRTSSVSQRSELMDFDTDLLNADHGSFSDGLLDNGSEEMGLDDCDASAFGVGMNPVSEMASKLASAKASAVAAKSLAADRMNSKFTTDPPRTGQKRRISDSADLCDSGSVKVKIESELEPHSPMWKKPDSDLLRKNSESNLSTAQRWKSESDSVSPRKSESDSCLYRKKSDSEHVYKSPSRDLDSVFRKKHDGESPAKKRTDSDSVRKKSDGNFSDSPHGNKKKNDSESNAIKKKAENEISSSNRKKSDSGGTSLLKCEVDSSAKKRLDNEPLNTSKRKSDSDVSLCKKSSEQSSVVTNSSIKSRTKTDSESPGIKMKISTRQYEERAVASPQQVLDLSRNKSSSRSGKDSPLDNGRGGVAMAVTCVSYNSSALKSSSSPLLNSTISPKTSSFSPSKSSNHSPRTTSHSSNSKSPSSHSAEKNNRTSREKLDKSKKTKHSSSSDSSKRKRDKDEYRREKKKKKLEELHKQPVIREDSFYQSTTVDYPGLNDKKQMPKLKITKSRGKVTVQTTSPKTGESIMKTVTSPHKSSQSPFALDDAFSFARSEVLEKEELGRKLSEPRLSHLSGSKANHMSERSSSSSQKSSSHKSGQRSTSKNITVSKADSKLMTKTPTIKLKPIVIPTTGASVTVGGVPNSNVQSSPQSASVLSTTSAKSLGQSPYASPSQASSRSATPTSASLSTLLSPGHTNSSPLSSSSNKAAPSLTPVLTSAASAVPQSNKIKSPCRLRKGSLSAVIDKLTKSTSIPSGKEEPSEETPRVKELASVASHERSPSKGSVSANSVDREHKSTTRSPSVQSSNRSGSDGEKTKSVNHSVSPVSKDNVLKKDKDKSDSGHKSRSESSDKRKSSSSSYERDKQKSSSSTSSSRREKSRTESSSSKQSGNSVRNQGSSSGSSQNQTSSKNQSHNSSRTPATNCNSGSQSKSSASSQSANPRKSPTLNSVKSSGGSQHGISKSPNSKTSTNSQNRITGSSQPSVKSQNSGNSEPKGVPSSNSSGSIVTIVSKDKVKDSAEKNNVVPSTSVKKLKPVESSTPACERDAEKQTSKENAETSNSSTASNLKEPWGMNSSGAVIHEKETRVDFDTWTPASPVEEKEHRSAEETAKIPVLERLQLEYTHDSNSPVSRTSVNQDNSAERLDTGGGILSGLLTRNDDLESVEKSTRDSGSVLPGVGASPGQRTANSSGSFAHFNGDSGHSDAASVSRNLSRNSPGEPPTLDSPVPKDGTETVKPYLGSAELSSPKVKKARPSAGTNNRPVGSPHSDASSPGNELVIDCPTTPKSNSLPSASPSPTPAPKQDSGRATPASSERVTPTKLSSPLKKISPGPSPKLPRHSPALSPVIKATSNPGSMAPSPCPVDIDDDDLMDDIVLGMGS